MSTSNDTLAARRARHREMLLVATVTVVAACLLQVRSDDRVALRMLDSLPLPPTCLSQQIFGVKCPGCGLTRSFVDLAHGDWECAWKHHRLGWLLALAVLLQFPYRILSLRHPDQQLLGSWLPKAFGYALIASLMGNWLLEIVGH
jgi:hypothetical protein